MAGPFPLDSLHEPLSPAQRTTILAWFQTAAGKSHTKKQLAQYIDVHPQNLNASDDRTIAFYIASGKNSHNENMDSAIITAYNNVLKGGDFTAPQPGDVHSEITNPISGVTDFLGMLTQKQLWIRVGEFAVGAILIAVAVKAALAPNASVTSAIPAGRAMKAMKGLK
jgi:hypothetical protein